MGTLTVALGKFERWHIYVSRVSSIGPETPISIQAHNNTSERLYHMRCDRVVRPLAGRLSQPSSLDRFGVFSFTLQHTYFIWRTASGNGETSDRISTRRWRWFNS